MNSALKNEFVEVVEQGWVEPNHLNPVPYNGHWALLKRDTPATSLNAGGGVGKGVKRTLAVAFGVETKVGDNVVFINKRTGEPVFASDKDGQPIGGKVRAEVESYREAKGQQSRRNKMKERGVDINTPVRDAALDAADQYIAQKLGADLG